MSLPDALPDFSKAPAAQLILPIERKPVASEAWKKRNRQALGGVRRVPAGAFVRRGDADFRNPPITSSTSEGTTCGLPEDLAYIRVVGARPGRGR